MVFERQKALEIFYTQIHHAHYKKDVNNRDHGLPRFLGDEKYDLAGLMLSHVMGKNLQPFDENWKEVGDLLQFPQKEFIDPSLVPGGDVSKAKF